MIDSAEPETIVSLLKQSVDVSVIPLNQSSRADYYFGGEGDKSLQFCRVQGGELLGNIDSQEDELRRYYDSADFTGLIIEGIVTDVPLTKRDKSLEAVSIRMKSRPSTLFSYRVTDSGYLFGEHAHNESCEKLYAWLFRLGQAGVKSYWTANYVMTAKFLSAVYHNTQKSAESHDTLNRYYIPRIMLGKKDEDGKRLSIREQNPFIRSLMALSLIYGLDIGEDRATALSKAGYKTLYDLAFAAVDELCEVKGIGKLTAEKLLTAIGVEDL